MSSHAPHQHLDAFAGRDVVYCHACQDEWYYDQHGLRCPQCDGEATEIVTAENDPRDMHNYSPSLSDRSGRRLFRPGDDSDSDPGEEDIEEHVQRGPGGMFIRRTIYRSPSRPGAGGGGRRPANPADGDAILERFTDMLMNDFRVGASGRSGPETLFPGNPHTHTHTHTQHAHDGPVPQFHQTTFRRTNFPGGSASFTITTTPLRRTGGPSGGGSAPEMLDFNTVFGNIMGNITPPVGHSPTDGNGHNTGNNNGGGAGNDRDLPPHGFPIAFQQLLGAIFGPPGGVHGDAVYSQEALDRIITSLMEANPASNAAPPASQSALDRLERKKLDAKMMGTDSAKVECTICIEEMSQGDEVVVLPCKHWFHDECAVLWLKEHNTCPICRHPIEERPSPSRANAPDASASASNPTWPAPMRDGPAPSPGGAGTRWDRPPLRTGPSGGPPGLSSLFGIGPEGYVTPSAVPPPPPLVVVPEEPSYLYSGHRRPSPPMGGTTTTPSASSSSAAAAAARANSSSYRRRDRLFRSPSDNEERLNRIRNNASSSSVPAGSGGGLSSGGGGGNQVGTPPLGGYRRNSLSPPSPDLHQASMGSGGGTGTGSRGVFTRSGRNRSPSPTSFIYRRPVGGGGGDGGSGDGVGGPEQQDRDRTVPASNIEGAHRGSSSGSHGPLGWIRNRLHGAGGGSSSSSNGGSGNSGQRQNRW